MRRYVCLPDGRCRVRIKPAVQSGMARRLLTAAIGRQDSSVGLFMRHKHADGPAGANRRSTAPILKTASPASGATPQLYSVDVTDAAGRLSIRFAILT